LFDVPACDVTSRFNQVFWLGDFNFRVEERQGVVEKFLRQCEEDDDPNYEVGYDHSTPQKTPLPVFVVILNNFSTFFL
jgi:hypothetical protein